MNKTDEGLSGDLNNDEDIFSKIFIYSFFRIIFCGLLINEDDLEEESNFISSINT